MVVSIAEAWGNYKNIAGDDALPTLEKAFGTYNFRNDPNFQKDMQKFQQNPTKAYASKIIDKWGGEDKLNVDDYKELAQKINYLEGTPQAYEVENMRLQTENNRLQNKITSVKADYAEPLTAADLGVKEEQLESAKNQNYMTNQTMDKAIEAENAKYGANINQYNYQGNLFDERNTESYINQKVNNEMTMSNAQARNAVANADASELNVKELETRLKYLDEQMQNQMTQQEQQILNNKINNQINNLELEQQRKLNPLEVKQVEANLKSRELQNKNMNMNNNIKSQTMESTINANNAQNNLTALQAGYKADALRNMENQDIDSLYKSLGVTNPNENSNTGKLNDDMIEYINENRVPTPSGYEGRVLYLNENNIVMNANTGNPFRDENGISYMYNDSEYAQERGYVPMNQPKGAMPNNVFSPNPERSQTKNNQEDNWFQKSLQSILPGGKTGYWGNDNSQNAQNNADNQAQMNESAQQQAQIFINQAQQNNMSINELISYLENNKGRIQQDTDLDINNVIRMVSIIGGNQNRF